MLAVAALALAVALAALLVVARPEPAAALVVALAAAVGLLVAAVWSLRSAQALRRQRRLSAERMAAFQRTAGIGMFEWDMRKAYAVVSPEYRAMMGLPPDQRQLTAEQWQELVHPEDRARVVAALDAAIKEDAPYDVEYRIRRPDGTVRWYSSRAVVFRDEVGRPERVLGAMLDIEDRKQAELAVQERERMFRQMADHAPVMIWVSDPQGYMTFFSRSCYAYTGRDEGQALGRGWLDVVHPDDRQGALAALLDAVEHRREFTVDLRIRRRDGTYRWMINTASPRFENGGRFVGLIGSVVDIQDRKESEERHALLMREVDHRAKNALAVVTSIIRITRADTMEGYAAAVEGRVAAMARAHTLLAASSWRGAALRRLLEDEVHIAGAPGDRLALDGPDVVLAADAVQPLTLVLHELTTNALKHGALAGGGGRLRVAWRPLAAGDLEIRWHEEVGRPIQPPARRGFGMELLETLVEKQLQGSIEFRWAAGGLDMRLRIPPPFYEAGGSEEALGDAGPVETLPPPARIGRRRPTGARILVVEDDVLIALSQEQMLLDSGYGVVGPCHTVKEALDLLATERPDAAVLDRNLAGDLSTPVAARLAEMGVPYTYCTGYGEEEGMVGAEAGVPILIKPFSAPLLAQTIEGLLSGQAGQRAARS